MLFSYSANKTHNISEQGNYLVWSIIWSAPLTVGAGWHGCERTFWSHLVTQLIKLQQNINLSIPGRNTFVELILQDLAHHSCPIPLILPLPSTVRWFTPWKYSHLRWFKPCHTTGSCGATIVPEIYNVFENNQVNKCFLYNDILHSGVERSRWQKFTSTCGRFNSGSIPSKWS